MNRERAKEIIDKYSQVEVCRESCLRGHDIALSDDRGGSSQVKLLDYFSWNKLQRERVLQRGHCDYGCNEECLITNSIGRVLCRHTMQPCDRQQRLRTIVELYSTIGE